LVAQKLARVIGCRRLPFSIVITTIDSLDDQPAVRCPDAGLQSLSLDDAVELVGDAFSARARTVIVPARRLPGEFFVLRSGFAGEFVHTFVKYHMRLVIVGDISAAAAKSPTFAAFVREANHGNEINFVTA
jgi:hypothetical protein